VSMPAPQLPGMVAMAKGSGSLDCICTACVGSWCSMHGLRARLAGWAPTASLCIPWPRTRCMVGRDGRMDGGGGDGHGDEGGLACERAVLYH
jgi:hypothetical protein